MNNEQYPGSIESKSEKNIWIFTRNILIKAIILFVLANFLFAIFNLEPGLGTISIYNHVIPGRERFPFGENPRESYNLSLYNINAMVASHELATEKQEDEFRVFILGDSATWGTLLAPDDTIAGQLNKMELTNADGKHYSFYNLGYPSLSLTKDLLFLEQTKKYQPDMIIWMLTLEAFPKSEQFSSPVVSNNHDFVQQVFDKYSLEVPVTETQTIVNDLWQKTMIEKRRSIADIIRLQFYGIPWAATGIDQYYPESFEAAQRDLSEEINYYDIEYPELKSDDLSLDVLVSAVAQTDIPVVIVNEPILISNGKNSDIRYNFYYPRWVYDEYRNILASTAEENDWCYFDYWDLVPEYEFTNTAIHMTPEGVSMFAQQIKNDLFAGK